MPRRSNELVRQQDGDAEPTSTRTLTKRGEAVGDEAAAEGRGLAGRQQR